MQLDPSGRLLAVSNFATGSLVLVDLATRLPSARLTGLPGPHHLAFARDGRLLYVGNLDVDQVSVVDVAAGKVVEQIALRPAEDAAGGCGRSPSPSTAAVASPPSARGTS